MVNLELIAVMSAIGYIAYVFVAESVNPFRTFGLKRNHKRNHKTKLKRQQFLHRCGLLAGGVFVFSPLILTVQAVEGGLPSQIRLCLIAAGFMLLVLLLVQFLVVMARRALGLNNTEIPGRTHETGSRSDTILAEADAVLADSSALKAQPDAQKTPSTGLYNEDLFKESLSETPLLPQARTATLDDDFLDDFSLDNDDTDPDFQQKEATAPVTALTESTSELDDTLDDDELLQELQNYHAPVSEAPSPSSSPSEHSGHSGQQTLDNSIGRVRSVYTPKESEADAVRLAQDHRTANDAEYAEAKPDSDDTAVEASLDQIAGMLANEQTGKQELESLERDTMALRAEQISRQQSTIENELQVRQALINEQRQQLAQANSFRTDVEKKLAAIQDEIKDQTLQLERSRQTARSATILARSAALRQQQANEQARKEKEIREVLEKRAQKAVAIAKNAITALAVEEQKNAKSAASTDKQKVESVK